MNKLKVINNAKWIVVCKIAQAVIQFVVGMLSARFLGPSNYGLINYAASIAAFFLPLMNLGLDSTMVREYSADPDQEGRIAGTGLIMNMLSAVACVIGMTSFAAIANQGETTTIIVCALYGCSLVFQAAEMLQYWFQAKLLSKHSSQALLIAYVAGSAYKIFLLATGKSVFWFALSHAVEYAVGALLLLIAYKKNAEHKLCFSFATAKDLFSRSRHYILPMFMEVIYSRTGSIIITLLYGETENGYFATAVTCVVVVRFFFMAIIDTARPMILEGKKNSEELFNKYVSRTYALTIWLALLQSVGFAVLAQPIVQILYGQEYLPAAAILQVLVWYTIFYYIAHVRNIWILAEEKHSVLWKINLCGAVVSVIANAILIPLWGACGAALATVVTQFVTNFVMGFVLKEIRDNNRLILKSLNPKILIELVSELKK